MPRSSIDFKTFSAEVYEVVRQIPKGKVATYGLIARLIGYPNHARFVGRAMSENRSFITKSFQRFFAEAKSLIRI